MVSEESPHLSGQVFQQTRLAPSVIVLVVGVDLEHHVLGEINYWTAVISTMHGEVRCLPILTRLEPFDDPG